MSFNTLNGKQIRNLVITNDHVSETAAIAESKLNVNWAAHYQEALESKKLLDYVQVNGVTVDNGGSVVVTAITGAKSTGTEVKGIDVSNSQPVIIRDAATGQPLEVNGGEVYGEISENTGVYTVAFKVGGVAVDLLTEFPTTTSIDLQYPRRFDLFDISQTFAMNEKFVDGAVDVTEIQNLRQLAKDIYGGSWSLDNNAEANGVLSDGETLSLKAHLDRIHGSNAITGSIDYEIKTQVIDPLAATTTGNGAALIGIADAGSLYTATNVEAALAEVVGKANAVIEDVGHIVALSGVAVDSDNLGTFTGSTIADNSTIKDGLQALETALNTLENSGGAEVAATHTRESNYENDLFDTSYTLIEDRLIDIETVLDAEVTRATGAESAIADDVASLVVLSGVAVDAEDLGTFTGATIADSSTIKGALQAIETAHEEVDVNVNDLVTLSGVTENAQHLGTFTGATIPDDQTVKGALQALETAFEEVDQNVNDLVTLTGVAENATHLGTFTGSTIADDLQVKGALQALETAHELFITNLATNENAAKGANLVGIQALANRTAAALTVQGGLNKLDADLKTVEDWKAAVDNKIHVHLEESFSPAADATTITTAGDFSASLDFFAVYVNGVRQLPTTHFSKAQGVGGSATKVVFTFTDSFVTGDNAYIEIMKYD